MPDKSIEETLGLDRPNRSTLKWFGLVAVAAVVLGVAWQVFLRPDRAAAVEFVTARAALTSFDVTVTANGAIEPTNLVAISSELSGTVERVMVDYNDAVEVGTVLAELDTTKLEAQRDVNQAALDAAIARVEIAQAILADVREKYETALQLSARGVTTTQDLASQHTALVRAEGELKFAIADRSLAKANLDLKNAELEQACICSPIKGVILDRAVDTGQIVAAALSAPVLFTVAEDLTKMELQVDIDEADIGLVAVGNPATFTVDAYDDLVFPAKIAEIRFAPETVDGVVTYKAVLAIDNGEMLLRPGMTATADIVVANVVDALAVPNAALRYAPPAAPSQDAERSGLLGMLIPDGQDRVVRDARTVWVMRDGDPQEVALETGLSNGVVTQITGGTLAVGDQVITDRVDG